MQVGDLVHRGPDTRPAVAMVDRFLTRHPDRWVQLRGNHEACHLGEARFLYEPLKDTTEQTPLRWDAAEILRIATALETSEGPVLVSHGGRVWTTGSGRRPTPTTSLHG